MIDRKINWVPSIKAEHHRAIEILEQQLAHFYATNPDYYASIDFTANNWIDAQEVGYEEIVAVANHSKNICEVGCGSANVLKHHPHLARFYTGCDFSDALIKNNQSRFPTARFHSFAQPNSLPFDSNSFDFVFSVFVLEHSTNPAKFLDECTRVLKPGGTLIILCPDFLATGRMTSQRAGWSEGTAGQKLKKGLLPDAVITLFDNRVRIPIICRRLEKLARQSPQFFINLSPVVFEDTFSPDVDAVYVTNKNEIITYLTGKLHFVKNSNEQEKYEKEKNLIFLTFEKRY